MNDVAVIGAGAWGTALAIVVGRNGNQRVRLWAYEPEVCSAINTQHTNHAFLDGVDIPDSVRASNDFAEVLRGTETVISVMPSHHCRRLFQQIAPHLSPETLVISATKGIENDSCLRMSEVIDSVVHQQRGFHPRIAVISGPSFAREVARGDPTAITAASAHAELARRAQEVFGDPAFRVYTHDDMAGVELGGALKNVIAIAAGICDGLGLGYNSVAALITRGLAEMTRLAMACGGRRETMAGLAGLGDLVLTCTGSLSRNRTVGVELGRGRKLPDIIAGMHGMVAEGVLTTTAAIGLAKSRNATMPVTEQVYSILQHGKPPKEAMRELLSRPFTSEFAS
ncbi:MAG TPA: NAD(P)H-dependent glycerol-3-phosphate dehydrogenase [Terriglobales bacterium]|nr:NAD(P)H-dependent glycerol-3-phosphate dehydrogenase [Terriglobales bacterium]